MASARVTVDGGEAGGVVAGVDLGFEDAEEGEVAVELAVIETIADDVGVGDLEAGVENGDVDQTALALVKEGADFEAGGLPLAEAVEDEVEGETGGDDVLDQEDVASGDIEVEIFGEADAVRLALVRGSDGEVIDGEGAGDGAGEVSEEVGHALEETDDDD